MTDTNTKQIGFKTIERKNVCVAYYTPDITVF